LAEPAKDKCAETVIYADIPCRHHSSFKVWKHYYVIVKDWAEDIMVINGPNPRAQPEDEDYIRP